MSLFDRLRGKREFDEQNVVYVFTFKIASGTTRIPPPMVGAYVIAYSIGDSPTAAADRAWHKLRSMGYIVEDMEPKGQEVPLAKWDEYIAHTWPKFPGHFPTQSELPSVLQRKSAVFSPFAGFE